MCDMAFMRTALLIVTSGALAQCQQQSGAFASLDKLRGRNAFSSAEIRALTATAKPNVTYPAYKTIPQTSFSCSSVRQPGFYADPEAKCQVYRRCEPGMPMASYLCPAGTLWNNIPLTCDFWWNVQCKNDAQFSDYSNPRIYKGPSVKLLDDTGNGNGNNYDQPGGADSANSLSGSYAPSSGSASYSASASASGYNSHLDTPYDSSDSGTSDSGDSESSTTE